MERRYYAPCTKGLEAALESELVALGAGGLAARTGGVAFTGDLRLGYKACLWLRSAIRVQEEIAQAECHGPDELYRFAADIEWERFMAPHQTLAVDASIRDSEITHSGYAALRVKDALVDRFRKRTGGRPDVDTERPDLPLRLVLLRNQAILYRDLSGESLHKRGWRPIQVKSPLNEATAAGLLILSGWDRQSPIVDPMCGSGTFPIEAALLAAERAPGMLRRFAFERWPDFQGELWDALRDEARARAHDGLPFVMDGADRHPGALSLARKGALAAGVTGMVRFTHATAAEYQPPDPPRTVFANPPYGERLGEGDDLDQSWRELGNFLHQRCKGADAFILSGSPELTRHLGLRADKKWPVMNGPIGCRLLRYQIGNG